MSNTMAQGPQENRSTGTVMTVLGPIPAADLGITLHHEHIFLDNSIHARDSSLTGDMPSGVSGRVSLETLGILHRNPFLLEDNMILDDLATAEREVLAFKEAGGSTIIEVTTSEFGRNPSKLVQLAQSTGVNIVMGCGNYRHTFHSPDFGGKTIDHITAEIVSEVQDGVGDDGPRAGIIGEIGISAPMHPNEEKALTAAVRAQEETNLAVLIHVHPWGTEEPMGYPVLRILEREEADLSRVILSHMDSLLDVNYHQDLLRSGVNIGYDHFGKEFHRDATHVQQATDLQRLEGLAKLISRGYIDQLLISHDVCFKMHLRQYGRWGYAHILEHIVLMAEVADISQNEMETLLVDNPRRVLAG